MDIFRSNHLHTKPSNFSLGHLVRTQCKIRRFCMEIIGPKNAHISAANCSKQLIFGEWAFFIMLFPNMQSHCIISQIHLFVTSHFTTLFPRKFVVNVSAMEGQFSRVTKGHRHPHTNMAKAALNMMTRTSGLEYQMDGIYMTAVDTGWVTDERPFHQAR